MITNYTTTNYNLNDMASLCAYVLPHLPFTPPHFTTYCFRKLVILLAYMESFNLTRPCHKCRKFHDRKEPCL